MSDPRRYRAVADDTDGTDHSAWVPDLPDCVAAADSRVECEQLIREAVVLHLKGMREDGEPIPSHHPWTRRS